MNIYPIKTETDYQAALAEIEALFNAEPSTPRGDRLEILTTLVGAYEEQHYALPAPDPVAALVYHMESRGLTRKNLEPYLGNRARVSEILNRKRALTLGMIRRLHGELGLSADVLLQPYALQTGRARKAPAPGQRRPPAGTAAPRARRA